MTTYRTETLLRCINCHGEYTPAEKLTAPNPWMADAQIFGCPHCKEPHEVEQLCDAEGCTAHASMGTPSPIGYKRTCFAHKPQ